jgi:apolipoprotein N-acyltransferase
VLDAGLPSALPPTVYARLGDIPAALIVAAALLLVVRCRSAKHTAWDFRIASCWLVY